MADALVLLPFQHLGLDADSCSTRGSFLADRPPLSPISRDEIFATPSPGDPCPTRDIQSFWPSSTTTSTTLSRRSSLASASSSATASRMFLSLSASTRSFFGQNRDIVAASSSFLNINSPIVESEKQSLYTIETSLSSSNFNQASLSNCTSGCDTIPRQEIIPNAENKLDEVASTSLAIFSQEPSSPPMISLSDELLSQMNFFVAPKITNPSFATGSLRYSKKSINTSKTRSPGSLDEATISRMKKRRDLIEELLQSEEVYISELKTLLNVYFGTVNDDIYPFTEKKATFIRTIGGVLDLHERLYQAMQNAIPRSFEARQSYWNLEAQFPRLPSPFNTANPAAAALVANAFDEITKDLLPYEDFISKYDAILKDGGVFKSNPHRRSWERDCELLANSFLSKSSRPELTKRALTFEDLLMKPIQRICKYPLFFTELLRVTPVIDCPESNAILEKVNIRVKDTIYQLDMAKDNSPKVRERLERNWLLQKRLSFKDKLGPVPIQLGQVVLCGPLYAVWKDSKTVQGDYLACLLYKSYLLLATVSKCDSSLNVVLAISLVSARIGEAAQGTGVQCHNAPFTWIVAFEHDFRMYEVILCAWNAREEDVWRKRIEERILKENKEWAFDGSPTQRTLFVRPIACTIEPSGSTGGYQGSLRRHWSFHGSVTPLQRTEPMVVSIQNTWAPSEPALQARTRTPPGLNRSSSVVNINNIFTLSPKRSSRSRVEHALTDVWSKDQLPLGASSWLLGPRKFSMGSIPSMASITSSFGRKPSQGFAESQSPVRGQESEYMASEGISKSEKRRSSSSERTKREKHEPSTPKDSVKEPKTPVSPVWPSWGSLKSRDASVTINTPTLVGDKGTWKRKRWSNPGNVMRFFECDSMFAGAGMDKKVEV